MPLLEAAHRDCPVLGIESNVLEEVLENGAFWFRAELRESLPVFRAFLDEGKRTATTARAAAIARRYSWESTARATREVYREVVASQRRG